MVRAWWARLLISTMVCVIMTNVNIVLCKNLSDVQLDTSELGHMVVISGADKMATASLYGPDAWRLLDSLQSILENNNVPRDHKLSDKPKIIVVSAL